MFVPEIFKYSCFNFVTDSSGNVDQDLKQLDEMVCNVFY